MTLPSNHTSIYFMGEAMVEFVRQGGPESPEYRMGIGGDTSNAAIAAARQGISTGYISAVGQDRFGDLLIQTWEREGINTAQVTRDPSAPTGIYFVDPDPASRHFTYYRVGSAASRMHSDPLSTVGNVGQARFFHLSGITLAVSDQLRAEAFKVVEMAYRFKTDVSVDTNLRTALWPVETARDTIHQVIAGLGEAGRPARFVFTSIEDGEQLTGLSDPAKIAAFYRDMGAATVVVTLGAEGCLLSDKEAGEHRIPAYPAEPVDSTGAGDSFVGSFLARMFFTGDAVRTARYAAYVAARTVSGHGATAPIPKREEVLNALDLES
ncbi:MAG: sugar kinase [Pseudomonadota bacterium]